MKYLIIMFFISSCSSVYHLKKAIKKDPNIIKDKIVNDTIQIKTIDSIPYIVNDTVYYKYFTSTKDTIIKFKYKYIKTPKSRQETRLEYKKDVKYNNQLQKTERLKVKMQKKIDKLQTRLDKRIKQTEIRNKNGGWKLWLFLLMIGFIIGGFVMFILKK